MATARYVWPSGYKSFFFDPETEFKHPELMDGDFIALLDKLRMKCGFALRVTSDARTQTEHEALYRKEIVAGESWPKDSAHLWRPSWPVRAVDLQPWEPTTERRLALVHSVISMRQEGLIKQLGLIIETKHVHFDDCRRLGSTRPYFGVGTSK